MSILVDQGFAARRKQLERDCAVGERTNCNSRDRRYVSRIGRKQRLVGKTSECRPGFIPQLWYIDLAKKLYSWHPDPGPRDNQRLVEACWYIASALHRITYIDKIQLNYMYIMEFARNAPKSWFSKIVISRFTTTRLIICR